MRLPVACLVPLLFIGADCLAQTAAPDDLAAALKAALQPALPYPDAGPDGTASDSATTPVWTVRWPEPGSLQVEVLANPLNPGNRERAMKAEEEIQKAAMASQRRSQADYEKALGDFQRTGKVSEIREISLRDDGLAGERYDAESQLTIRAEVVSDRRVVEVATARLPEAMPASDGPAFVVRLAAHTYVQAATADEPAMPRFCPEQAWVLFGALDPPVVTREGDEAASVAIAPAGAPAAAPGGRRGLVVALSGNVELVDRVLRLADWAALAARFGG
jgi:hypothetical protein